MKSIFRHIYLVDCPCEITDPQGNLLYYRASGQSFVLPLAEEIKVKQGRARFLGVQENFYQVNPPPMPQGWDVSFSYGDVPRKAEIFIDHQGRKAASRLDRSIFGSKQIPEGCKVFMVFHEIGHLIHGDREDLCDEFAFFHALRAGVSPYLCYVAIRHFMPEGAEYRIEALGRLLVARPWLKYDLN